jgi:hypothetical protein
MTTTREWAFSDASDVPVSIWAIEFAGRALEAHLVFAHRVICQLATAVPADNVASSPPALTCYRHG